MEYNKVELNSTNDTIKIHVFKIQSDHLEYSSVDKKKIFCFWFLGVGWEWGHLVCRSLFGLLCQLPFIGDEECGAVCGKSIVRGNRSTRRKPTPMTLCSPQMPHDLTWARTQAVTFGSRRLTALAMAWPEENIKIGLGERSCEKVECFQLTEELLRRLWWGLRFFSRKYLAVLIIGYNPM
jgi:hypothetical protein